MIREQRGNLLNADADALVNTVNTVGVMGKGIALQFKRAYPENFKAYKRACDLGDVKLGRMFVWDAGSLAGGSPRFIINFPTKGHWRSSSRIDDIEAGLVDLVAQLRDLPVRSVAVPPLGCGHGGLRWEDVRPLIVAALEGLPDLEVLLVPPDGAPSAAQQPIRTDRPAMTPGRAALIRIMEHYLPFAVDITAVDIQKLMYFLQEAGEPLRLNFVKGRYGPYADNLRHVLSSIEGHYIRGVGDGSSKALDSIPFEILDGASAAATAELDGRPETAARMRRVASLIEGFESTYGLELLATVHWSTSRSNDGALRDAPLPLAEVQEVVEAWNRRKGQLFTRNHVTKARERLARCGWFDEPEPDSLSAAPTA
jgi:O-acetyl-ADP-ribose deacetylase (regulator of RNase III)